MKRTLLLCAAVGAALVVIGCTNRPQDTSNTAAPHGLVNAQSVAPVSGGPSRFAQKPRVEP